MTIFIQASDRGLARGLTILHPSRVRVQAFNPQLPVGVWVADFAPHLVLTDWALPIRQLVRADDNLQRAASGILIPPSTSLHTLYRPMLRFSNQTRTSVSSSSQL
jgi:hypothetical protein